MNILYISKLSGNRSQGPTYSVPMQIFAQSHYDNVFWYNMNTVHLSEWSAGETVCHTIKDYPSGRLKDLPKPFDEPDIVIIQQCYNYPFSSIIADIRKKKIPYIIVPRSSLTRKAQEIKKLKKIVGNLVYFNSFIKNAASIHYLTEEERRDSEAQWKVPSFVIPNGITMQDRVDKAFSVDRIKGLYIGRVRIGQKRLDLLIRAVAEIQDELRDARFAMHIYGEDYRNEAEKLRSMAIDLGIDDLIQINGPVFGEEKHQKLLMSDVFIMTSDFEGHPMGMIEALAHGVPCIATSGTNLAARIEEFNAGWNAGSTREEVVHAFRQMIKSREEFKTKSMNAIKLSKEYEWYKIAEDSHNAYESIIKKRDLG